IQAVFAGVDKAERAFDADPTIARMRRALMARKAELPALAAKADRSLLEDSAQNLAAAWERHITETTVAWHPLDPEEFTSSGGATLTKLPDGAILSSGTRPDKDTVTITSPVAATRLTGL